MIPRDYSILSKYILPTYYNAVFFIKRGYVFKINGIIVVKNTCLKYNNFFLQIITFNSGIIYNLYY
jgi:hypothetical protein